MGFFADLKEAVIETAENRPETAAKLAWGAGVTIFCVSNWLAVSRLKGVLRSTRQMLWANSIYDDQRIYNLGGKIDYIAEQLNLDKEALDAAGSASARANWQRLGYNDTHADAICQLVDNTLTIPFDK